MSKKTKSKVIKPDANFRPEEHGLYPRKNAKVCPRTGAQYLFSPWTVPATSPLFTTAVGRAKGWTEYGTKFFGQMLPKYCDLVRTATSRLSKLSPEITGDEANAALREVKVNSGLPSRVYNSALVWAKGQHSSLVECATGAAEVHAFKYSNTIDKCEKKLEQGEDITGLGLKVDRHQRKCELFTERMEHPYYFPGRNVYYNQHTYKDKEKFREDYYRARNSTMFIYGYECESNGNQLVHPKLIGIKDRQFIFGMYNGKELLHYFSLDFKKGQALNDQLELQESRIFTDKVMVEVTKPDKTKVVEEQVRNQYWHKKGKCPLTIAYQRIGLTKKFTVTVIWSRDVKQVNYKGLDFLGIDINKTNYEWSHINLKDKELKVVKTGDYGFMVTDPSANRIRKFHKALNELVKYCKENNCCLVLENLEFEGAKMANNTIAPTLHLIPYRKIREICIRKCLQQEVALRFVNPAMTSQFGAILTEYSFTRDTSASVMVAVKASMEGLLWLEKRSEKLLREKIMNLRLNKKNQVGKDISVENEPTALVSSPLRGACLDTSGFLHYTGLLASKIRSINRLAGDIYWSKYQATKSRYEATIAVPKFWLIPSPPLGVPTKDTTSSINEHEKATTHMGDCSTRAVLPERTPSSFPSFA